MTRASPQPPRPLANEKYPFPPATRTHRVNIILSRVGAYLSALAATQRRDRTAPRSKPAPDKDG
jgi:hypothetical protein